MRVFCRGPVVPQVICTSRDADDAVRARFVKSVHRTFIDLPLNRNAAALQACAARDTLVRRCPIIGAPHEHEQRVCEIAVLERCTGRKEGDSGLIAAAHGAGCVNEAGAGGDKGSAAPMGPSHDRDFGGDDIGLASEVRKRSQAVEGMFAECQATDAGGGYVSRGEAIQKDGDVAQSSQPLGPLGIVRPDPGADVEEHNAWERARTFRTKHRGRDRCAHGGICTLEGDPFTAGRGVSLEVDAEHTHHY